MEWQTVTTLSTIFVLPIAMSLDALVGDPRWLPHPIRWMGTAIAKGELFFRKPRIHTALSGALFAVTLIAGCWGITWLLVRMMYHVHPLAGMGLEIILLFYCLSARSLAQAAMSIYHLLECEQISSARTELSFIVGRDVTHYQSSDIARATVETIAENFVDGVLSPLFYAIIGGAPLAMAYKMVNTLDSMVGYKNPRYILFGRAAARIDDVANYIPARLAVPVIALAARLLLAGLGRVSLNMAKRDGARHSSPNAGYPEAAFAGALGLRLGGPNIYHGVWVEKPYIGDPSDAARTIHIKKACQLMLLSSLVAGLAFWSARLIVFCF
jgi:adenosylcobinamide-phosphate synthase